MKKFKKIIILVVTGAPFMALAIDMGQYSRPGYGGLTSVIDTVSGLIGSLVPIIIAIALVVFLWGIISYITAGDDPKKKAAARGYMIYGIIGLFVMVSVWGLVRILQSTFGTEGTVSLPTPEVPKP